MKFWMKLLTKKRGLGLGFYKFIKLIKYKFVDSNIFKSKKKLKICLAACKKSLFH